MPLKLHKKLKRVFDIDHEKKFAEFIIMIGIKKYWGKGIKSESIKLLKKYCKKLGLKKLKLNVYKNNKRALHAYKKNGFKIVKEKNNEYLMQINLNDKKI